MVRRVAFALLLAICSCSSTERVTVTITNRSTQPIVIRARTWIFSRTLVLPPGGSWNGVVDRRVIGKTAEIFVD